MTSGEILNLIEHRFPASRRVQLSAEAISALAELLKAYYAALTYEKLPLYNWSWPNPIQAWPVTYPPSAAPATPFPGPTITCEKPFISGTWSKHDGVSGSTAIRSACQLPVLNTTPCAGVEAGNEVLKAVDEARTNAVLRAARSLAEVNAEAAKLVTD